MQKDKSLTCCRNPALSMASILPADDLASITTPSFLERQLKSNAVLLAACINISASPHLPPPLPCISCLAWPHEMLDWCSPETQQQHVSTVSGGSGFPPSSHGSRCSICRANGTVINAAGVTTSGFGGTTFNSVSAVTYDYTKNIGGLVSFVVSSSSDSEQYIGISFTESSMWISPDGSDATQNIAIDETLWFKITGPGNYSVEPLHDRGGFRYLNVYHNSTGNVTLSHLQTYFTAMPHFPDDGLREYTGYFHSNDEKLNRVWYAAVEIHRSLGSGDLTREKWVLFRLSASASLIHKSTVHFYSWTHDRSDQVGGAYTDQLCTIPSTAGNSLVDLDATDPDIPTVWWSNSTLTNGSSAFTDGPKRDKLIWPGDFAISVPGVFLSTDDEITVKLSLQQLFASQNTTTGALPWFAQPVHVYPKNNFINLGKIVTMNICRTIGTDSSLFRLAERRHGWSQYRGEQHSQTYLGRGSRTRPSQALQTHFSGTAQLRSTKTTRPPPFILKTVMYGPSFRASRPPTKALQSLPHSLPAGGLTVLQLQKQPQRAIDLMRFMWADFMLDDPRMTNSTYIEGYDTSGALHYPAYADDARISHSHGWSSGPVLALSTFAAGLHVLNATSWVAHPQPGNLTNVEAGFRVGHESYAAKYSVTADGTRYTFSTPAGTQGSLFLDSPSCNGKVTIVGSVSDAGDGHSKSKRGIGHGKNVVFGVLLPRQRTRVPVMARLRLMGWLEEIILLI
ncbi:bacterial alpha-L-rhamnosidase domain-containing protein, partial [Aureobasidium melanogenum]